MGQRGRGKASNSTKQDWVLLKQEKEELGTGSVIMAHHQDLDLERNIFGLVNHLWTLITPCRPCHDPGTSVTARQGVPR